MLAKRLVVNRRGNFRVGLRKASSQNGKQKMYPYDPSYLNSSPCRPQPISGKMRLFF